MKYFYLINKENVKSLIKGDKSNFKLLNPGGVNFKNKEVKLHFRLLNEKAFKKVKN